MVHASRDPLSYRLLHWEQRVLQKDGFFRKRDERREEAKREDNLFRPTQTVTTAPAPAANAAASTLLRPGFSWPSMLLKIDLD